MSNTPFEKYTNQHIIRRAEGNVLIAGLGIGMILLELQDNPRVTSITVIEKYQEVIDMVASRLPLNSHKVKIICADIWKWDAEEYGKYFDTIYFDIWGILT